ncbi:hypothetical protein [Parafrankia sp. FMc2]|uniref:hypothetical protein n=1 Tax=Parafrankia sp. FMc2 TaxID=3233196 RepID=UPI0034D67A61
MADDREDRRVPSTLFATVEHLMRRRRGQPLPMIVVHGVGGAGKTHLLDEVEKYYEYAVPTMRIDAGPELLPTYPALLEAMLESLVDGHDEFGSLRLRRLQLVMLLMKMGQIRPRSIRRVPEFLLGGLSLVYYVLEEAADEVPLLSALLRAFRVWVFDTVLRLPSPVRRLFAPRQNTLLRWLERDGWQALTGTSGHRQVRKVFEEFSVHRQRDSPAGFDRLLVQALVDDLRAAYRTHPRRRVSCLLLVDDADLVEATGSVGSRPLPALLRDLAGQLQAHPDLGLLVVATAQTAPPPGSAAADPDDEGEQEPAAVAAALVESWRTTRSEPRRGTRPAGPFGWYDPRVMLAFHLEPLSRARTRHYLRDSGLPAALADGGGAEDLLDRLHLITRGHPLAVTLIRQYLHERLATNSWPRVSRALLEARLRDTPRGTELDSIQEYLDLRFLHRFPELYERPGAPPDPDLVDRDDIRDLLRTLAVPRRLTDEVLRLLGIAAGSSGLAALRAGGLCSPAPDGRGQLLQPLLRDLHQQDPADPRYTAWHQELRDHVTAALGSRRDEQGADEVEQGADEVEEQTDLLYHALALGDVEAVVTAIAAQVGRQETWPTVLEAVTEAPIPSRPLVGGPPSGGGEPDHGPGERARVLQRLLVLLWRRRSVRPGEGGELPPWLAGELDDVGGDSPTAAIAEAFRACADPAGQRAAERYEAMAESDDDGLPPPGPVHRPRPHYRYPALRPTRQETRMLALATVVLLIVGYGTAYVDQRADLCHPAGFTDVRSVLGARWDPYVLDKVAGAECIGVAWPPVEFATGSAGAVDSWRTGRITDLSRLISAENDRVSRIARQDDQHRVVKVVVATQLSTAQEPPYFDLAVGINELIGALLGMQAWNGASDQRPAPVLVQVVLANLGGTSAHAAKALARVQQLAESDPSVVAVIGLGQTRAGTAESLATLGSAGIPMIASAQSGDALGQQENYYRIAPANWLQAQLGTAWIRQEHPDALTSLIISNRDNYSAGLAGDYRRQLAGSLAAIDDRDVIRFDEQTPGLSHYFQREIQHRCDREPEKDQVLVYTGRANEAIELVRALGSPQLDADCAGRVTMLGGDDMTQTEETEMQRELRGNPAHIYFTTFGTTSEARHILPDRSRQVWEQLYCDYDQLRVTTLPQHAIELGGHIQVAYDVFGVLADIARQLGQQHAEINRETIRGALAGTSHEGATGLIDFTRPEFTVEPWTSDGPASDVRPERTRLVVLQELHESDDTDAAAGSRDEDEDEDRTVVTKPTAFLANGDLVPIALEEPQRC